MDCGQLLLAPWLPPPFPRPSPRRGGGGARPLGIPLFMEPSSPYRLKPFTSYKFRVKATNDIGDSEFSEESEPLTTLQAGQCPRFHDFSLDPLCTCSAPGNLFWGGRASKDGRGTTPAGPFVWLPGQSPTDVRARGAWAMGLAPTPSLASSHVSSLMSPKLVADPRKPVNRSGEPCSSSSLRGLCSRSREKGALGPWVWAGLKV